MTLILTLNIDGQTVTITRADLPALTPEIVNDLIITVAQVWVLEADDPGEPPAPFDALAAA